MSGRFVEAAMATETATRILVDVREQPVAEAEREFVATVSAAVETLDRVLTARMSVSARIDLMRGCCGCGEHLGAFVSFTAHESGRDRMRHEGRDVLASLDAIEFSRTHLRYD